MPLTVSPAATVWERAAGAVAAARTVVTTGVRVAASGWMPGRTDSRGAASAAGATVSDRAMDPTTAAGA